MSARQEYELKARLREPMDRFCRRLEDAGWSRCFTGRMIDLRFDTPDGRLAERDEVLRLRVYLPEDGEDGGDGKEARAVLGWKGPAARDEGFKRREEVETRIASAEAADGIVRRLGFSRVTDRIDRRIRLFVKEGVSARIEEYPEMDVLVELEGPPGEVRGRMADTGLSPEEWKPWPLPEFVRRYEERTGREARLHEADGRAGANG